MPSGSTARTSASAARCTRRSCDSRTPASRISTTRPAGSSIAPWCVSSPPAPGSSNTTTLSSPARPASARPISHVRSRSRLVAKATEPCTGACRASSTSWRSPAPMAPTRGCSRASPASTSSFSTTGDSRPSATSSAAICSRSSRTATATDPRSSPARSPSRSGTTTSATPPSPMRSAIACSTTPTRSCYKGRREERDRSGKTEPSSVAPLRSRWPIGVFTMSEMRICTQQSRLDTRHWREGC